MSGHFNKLTPAETERLTLLIEECSEVIQAVTKILRHGYNSRNPFDNTFESNRHALAKEIGHVEYAAGLLITRHDVDGRVVTSSIVKKGQTINKWLHHQEVKDE